MHQIKTDWLILDMSQTASHILNKIQIKVWFIDDISVRSWHGIISLIWCLCLTFGSLKTILCHFLRHTFHSNLCYVASSSYLTASAKNELKCLIGGVNIVSTIACNKQLLPWFYLFLHFWHLHRAPSLFLSGSVCYYRQPMRLWCIRDSLYDIMAQHQLPNTEMWATYGPKRVWKRMLISWTLLSASEGGVGENAYVCVHVRLSTYVWAHARASICCLAQQGGMSGRPKPTAGGDQLRDKHWWGHSPSSHMMFERTEPFHNTIMWWTRTSSSITPHHTHSLRGHSGQAYCEWVKSRRWHWTGTSLEKLQDYKASVLHSFWATVFVFLLWVWFAVGVSQMGNTGYSPRASALVS